MASAGFTIAPLSSKYQAAGISQECLVTMVLKLDLGGWLSEQSRMGWLLRPFMHGIHSSYLEPMLMSVIALRDKVRPLMYGDIILTGRANCNWPPKTGWAATRLLCFYPYKPVSQKPSYPFSVTTINWNFLTMEHTPIHAASFHSSLLPCAGRTPILLHQSARLSWPHYNVKSCCTKQWLR